MARQTPADVYILDISMPVLNGITATERLKALDPSRKVIILSMHDSMKFVEKALRAGADGYILKQSSSKQVLAAIKEVHAGGAYLSPQVTKYVVREFIDRPQRTARRSAEGLITKKEREILQLLAEGGSKKDIATALAISVNTVHVHINNIMQKLDIHSRVALVRFAIREGITHA